jgi:hypothetical protein
MNKVVGMGRQVQLTRSVMLGPPACNLRSAGGGGGVRSTVS